MLRCSKQVKLEATVLATSSKEYNGNHVAIMSFPSYIHDINGLFYLVCCWKFSCFFIRTGNNTSTFLQCEVCESNFFIPCCLRPNQLSVGSMVVSFPFYNCKKGTSHGQISVKIQQ